TPVPSPYTHSFHAFGHATVAQWQSTGFVNQMLWVQLPPVASRGGDTGFWPQEAGRNKAPRSLPGKHQAYHAAREALPGFPPGGGYGQMAERPMAPDCKSGGLSLRRFESCSAHYQQMLFLRV